MAVVGEVPNFVPVTDEMLRDPDPGDWPMIRRDYHATSFTPLDQITPENVDDLELVYTHPMNEPGTNQPAPIVHAGVIYLAHTGGIIQAIDGANGDVIWQNNLGRNIARRCIAIYQDKIYLASRNIVMTLNARTGENEWQTTIGEGFNNSSGPIVADGKVIQGLGGCSRYQDEKCFPERVRCRDRRAGLAAGRPSPRSASLAGDSWGNLSNRTRAGGEMWITPSYDPVLNMTYVGTAQAKPWMTLTRGTTGDGLLFEFHARG